MRTRRLPRSSVALMLAVALAACAGVCSARNKTAALRVKPHCGLDGSLDWVSVGNRKVEMRKGSDNLDALKAALDGRVEAVQVAADLKTPYRCIGGLIFSLQRLGVSKVGFIAQPLLEGADKRP